MELGFILSLSENNAVYITGIIAVMVMVIVFSVCFKPKAQIENQDKEVEELPKLTYEKSKRKRDDE